MARTPKAPFELRDGEQHVAHSPAARVHALGATFGRIWLTSERVVFQPVVPLVLWILPPLALSIYLIYRPQRRELPLSQIGSHARGNFGRNRNLLVLGTRDLASRDLKVVVDDVDAFTAALAAQPALAAPAPSP